MIGIVIGSVAFLGLVIGGIVYSRRKDGASDVVYNQVRWATSERVLLQGQTENWLRSQDEPSIPSLEVAAWQQVDEHAQDGYEKVNVWLCEIVLQMHNNWLSSVMSIVCSNLSNIYN